jgi:hypothetical protein
VAAALIITAICATLAAPPALPEALPAGWHVEDCAPMRGVTGRLAEIPLTGDLDRVPFAGEGEAAGAVTFPESAEQYTEAKAALPCELPAGEYRLIIRVLGLAGSARELRFQLASGERHVPPSNAFVIPTHTDGAVHEYTFNLSLPFTVDTLRLFKWAKRGERVNAAVSATIRWYPTDEPRSRATLRVNFRRLGRPISPLLYGANVAINHRMLAERPDVQAAVRDDLGLTFLRLWCPLPPDYEPTLSNADGQYRWDATDRYVQSARDTGACLLMCLNGPPPWIKPPFDLWNAPEDARADTPQFQAFLREYTQFCCDLVRHLNVQKGYGIRYWEVFNEPDSLIDRAPTVYNAIFNAVAPAMKAVDPTIRVGGPCLAWPVNWRMKRFLDDCAPQTDFVSWHQYRWTSATWQPSNDEAMLAPRWLISTGGWDYPSFLRMIRDACGDDIETFVTETNLLWGAYPDQQGSFMSAYHASQLAYFAELGVTGVAYWDYLGDSGLMGTPPNVYPVGQMVSLFGEHFRGKLAHATSSDESCIQVAAARSDDADLVAVINKRPWPAEAQVRMIGARGPAGRLIRIGYRTREDSLEVPGALRLQLGPYEVCLIIMPTRV